MKMNFNLGRQDFKNVKYIKPTIFLLSLKMVVMAKLLSFQGLFLQRLIQFTISEIPFGFQSYFLETVPLDKCTI